MDTIIEILYNASPDEFKAFMPSMTRDETPPPSPGVKVEHKQGDIKENITKTFLGLTILSFIQNGLIPILHERSQYDTRATQILQVIMVLTDRLLPHSLCMSLHSEFDNSYATEMTLELLDDKNISATNRTLSILTNFHQTSSQLFKKSPTNQKLENVKTKVDSEMDDLQYQTILRETNVLTTKDPKKWGWNQIQTLVYGPMRVTNRLIESIRITKFHKRLFYFYNPKKKVFSDIDYEEQNMFYSQLGCQLMENLLSAPEGVEVLKNSEFLKEIKEILEQELVSKPDPNRILSEKNIAKKMGREYFALLGKMSSIPQGVKLLEEYNIFSLFSRIIKETSRDELIQLIIQHLDYSHPNDSLNINSKEMLKDAISSKKKNIRYLAPLRLRNLLKEIKRSDFQEFGIHMLYHQLSDTWESISQLALEIITQVCQTPENLDVLISLDPDITIFEQNGQNLLLRMLSRESGFEFLRKKNWIEPKLKEWRDTKIIDYALTIEHTLKRSMLNDSKLDKILDLPHQVYLSPHFYGEICKTKFGCELIRNSGHLNEFTKILDESTDFILKRSVMWSLGQMASNDIGYDFVNGDSLMERFIKNTETMPSLSLRGLCMYIISEMAKCSKARAKLESLNWECHFTDSIVIAYPKNPRQFFSLTESLKDEKSVSKVDPYTKDEEFLSPIENETCQKIITQIIRLANPVTESSALTELKKLRLSTNVEFSSREVIFRILYLMDKYRYAKKTRNILFTLFQDLGSFDIDFAYLDQEYNQ